MFRILAITATLLGLASTAQADVYRWTGADGTVQYSDRWVPGSARQEEPPRNPEERQRTTPPPPRDQARAQPSARQQDMAKVKAKGESC
jgi:hypothetical protein